MSRCWASRSRYATALLTPLCLVLTVVAAPRQSVDGEFVKTIRGVVRDLAGTPVSGARVFVFTPTNNQTRTLRTDADGEYRINGLPGEADYQVRVVFGDVETDTRVVSGLLAREDNILNFTLDQVIENTGSDEDGLFLVTLDGVRIYGVLDLPEGVQAPIPVALLLHGFGEDHNVWSALKERLLRRSWAVLAIDLRGHGRSRSRGQATLTLQPQWRRDPQQFPLDLAPAIDFLKTRPRLDTNRVAVIGSDIGASLALIASGRYSEVGTVVVLNPNLDEALSMAGTARDFAPRTTQIIVSDPETGERVREHVTGGSRLTLLDPPPLTNQTAVWLGAADAIDEIVRWLRDTY